MSDHGCTAKKGCLHNNVMCGFPLCAWGKACMKTPDAEGLPAAPPHHSIEGEER
jgi:hypothetical protein